MLSVPDRAAEIMEHLVTDPSHGYSQPNRAGVGTGGTAAEFFSLSDGYRVGVARGDRDCSSAAIECYAAQGIATGGAWSTSDMVRCMVSTGLFEKLPRSTWRNPERGDMLVAQGKHVAMALGDGKVGEFVRSERHSAHGTPGDQDGGESIIRGLYDDGWDCVLRYCGPDTEEEVTNEDIERIAQLAADKVVNYELNGVLLRDRIIGTDNAANGANNKLADTSDPTGRGMEYTTHDHVKWMAKKQADHTEKLDAIAEALADIKAGIDALGVLLSK